MSPYVYAENNPVLKNDPTGLLTQAQFDAIVDYLLKSDGGEGDIWYPDENGGGGRYERRLNPDKWMMDYLNTYDGWKYTDFGGGSGSSFSSRVFELGGNTYFGLVEFVAGKATSMVINTLSLLEPGAYKQEGAYQFLEVDQNGGSLPLLPYKEAVDIGLTGLGFFNDAFNTAGEITSLHVAKNLQKITSRQVVSLAKFTKWTAVIGGVITVGVAGYEYHNGDFDSHSIVDITAGTVLLGVGVVGGILASPAILVGVAVGGVVYGVASAVGSDWFDEATNHAGADWVYGKKGGGK